jgi:enoyl-CoA hydratase
LKALAHTDALGLYFGQRAKYWDDVRRLQVPLVAAVDGYCLGAGFELALLCDIVVASEAAQFGLPETSLGLVPGAGGTQRLPRALGKAKTMEVVLAGRLLTALECERAGIVSRVVPREALLDKATSIAREIASRAPVAQRLAKELVNTAFDLPLEAGLGVERTLFAIAFSSEDAREGIQAFLEKRKPGWRGR